ncbi:Rossmann-like and DUF2520 domain-containing protein [Odoribacter laneus]|jgi:hypothetical protein bacD2_16425|uniref:Rossmann-like and DUF2520 domain-containing protein n=1 Tax=Odoribacter laneus TaxID=626933 RepID=UPI00033C2127|nr:Rossmann-like and DUF2520 domain-containing protein [Odoribacter laneus]CCZ81674.1 putative uncharacterized protein [Odoribacter laneus CAG:561]
MMNKKIVLIGAGNVAHHLAPALLRAGMNLCQIYSRTLESARELGRKTGITYTSDTFAVYPDGDIYIFCVSDDALLSVFKSLRINEEALILHTSGSVPLDIFKPYRQNYGVLYPLQTFSKTRNLDFGEIPLCIEAPDKEVLKTIGQIADKLSSKVYEISSEKRKKLHLAAVLANNFTNHLYHMAGKLLEKEDLDFNLLRPLIFETAHKVMQMIPENAQTGPARRGDTNILNLHKSMLKDNRDIQTLYVLLSQSIQQTYSKKEKKEETENNAPQWTLW